MDLENAALLIVDMQNDVIHEEGFRRKYALEFGMPAETLDMLKSPIPYIKTPNIKEKAVYFS